MNLYDIFKKNPVICTDSRKCEVGSIFFALKGENFDANAFALSALESGCAYAVVDNKTYAVDNRIILVDNVLETLQRLAHKHRKKSNAIIIGITGTNGKTTTKELIAAVLKEKYSTLYTQENLNNHIGVPLTLLQLKPSHQIAVIEMGANHPGEIKTLAEIAEPDYGIITNVGKAHLEGFGSFEGVMRTKSELYAFVLHRGGKIFINSGNSFLNEMAQKNGLDSDNSIAYQINTSLDKHWAVGDICSFGTFLEMNCTTSAGEFTVKTQLTGAYNAENVLAAVAIGRYFGLNNDEIKKGIEKYEPRNNRSQLIQTDNNRIIVDAYNANPTSMHAAIKNFLGMNVDNKMYILGDMLELGVHSDKEHQLIVDLLVRNGEKNVILVGKSFQKTKNPFCTFENADKLRQYLNENPPSGQIILLKGSRGIKLEKILEEL